MQAALLILLEVPSPPAFATGRARLASLLGTLAKSSGAALVATGSKGGAAAAAAFARLSPQAMLPVLAMAWPSVPAETLAKLFAACSS